jgi:hypothetical protein
MATSRRKFIKTGTIVALASGLPLKVAANTLTGADSWLSFSAPGNGIELNMDSFRNSLNSNFLLSKDSNTAIVKLTEVRDLRVGRLKNSKKECFALTFAASEKPNLHQDTYDVKHDSLGNFKMLLVPVGTNKYEAIFNRLR